MTLTITIVTPRVAYQSADYRLVDVSTGQARDFETQKTTLVNRFSWTALISFSGVGKTSTTDVSEWIADKIEDLAFDADVMALLDALKTADDWLSAISNPLLRRHSFSVGGFVGDHPFFSLISNFETPSGLIAPLARHDLSIWHRTPKDPVVFVSGQYQEVPRAERRRLRALALKDPDPELVYRALADVNRAVSMRNDFVSEACFISHARLTGEGGGRAVGLDDRPFLPRMAVPAEFEDVVRRLIDEQFGPGRGRLVSISTMRAEASDDYHKVQLREKPDDPNVHSNYGAFLADRGDDAKAEVEYRAALELDPSHVNALGNLGNLAWKHGDPTQARELYERALANERGNEGVTWNYTRFLVAAGDLSLASTILHEGVHAHPESGRLRLLETELLLMTGDPAGAVNSANAARVAGADQAQVEALHAVAMQLSGASIGECIGAYQVALALDTSNSHARLNLAQLLFAQGAAEQGLRELRLTQGLSNSAKLEKHLYELAHTDTEPRAVLNHIGDLLASGTRTQWSFGVTLAKVTETNPAKAVLLGELTGVLAHGAEGDVLEQLGDQLWSLDEQSRSASEYP